MGKLNSQFTNQVVMNGNFRECQVAIFHSTVRTETDYTEKHQHTKYSAVVQ